MYNQAQIQTMKSQPPQQLTKMAIVEASSYLSIEQLPLGKYEYHDLPMIQYNSPDMIPQHMNKVFIGLEYVGTYIDDLFIISNKPLKNLSSNYTNY